MISGQKLSPEHREKVIKTLRYGGEAVGELNPMWKGGIHNRADGYVLMKTRFHPRSYKNGYIKRATLVLEEKLGRYLRDGEVVHHVNGIRNDDRPENLEVMLACDHDSLTAKERWASGEMRQYHMSKGV